MDTAVVVVRASREAVSAFLSTALPGESAPWLVPGEAGPLAFVNISDLNRADLETTDVVELRERLGSPDLLALLVDVRVRNIGCSEVRSFVVQVLDHFHGLASDDLLEHWWTASEIRNPTVVGRRVFWPHEAKDLRASGDA